MTTLPDAFLPRTPDFAAAELYTLIGTGVAMVLGAIYLRLHLEHDGWLGFVFNALCTLLVGWWTPKLAILALLWAGRMDPETVDAMIPKAWALSGLVCGLAGTTVVNWTIETVRKRLPGALDGVGNFVTRRRPPPEG